MYEILARIVLVVVSLHVLGAVFIVGKKRLFALRGDWLRRLREVLPVVLILAAALLTNNYVRQVGPDISWTIGIEITDTLFQLEGEFVVWLQSFATTPTTVYFSYMYVYGYAFLLTFPLVAYFAYSDTSPVRTLLSAYLFNYAIGLVVYLLIVAYGPRNILPHAVEPLLYAGFPEYQHLTRQVNRSTNVFPSLHTSLSMTVLFMAIRTRDVLPRWLPVAAVFALSIVFSTMFLGIHWASDVVAGIVLAAMSVALGVVVVERKYRRLFTLAAEIRQYFRPSV